MEKATKCFFYIFSVHFLNKVMGEFCALKTLEELYLLD